LTPAERIQLANLIRTFAHQASDAEWQHKAHLLDSATLDTATRPLTNVMAWPAARAMWKIARTNYSQHMIEMIDRLAQARALRSPADANAIWDAAVAEVMTKPSATI
jgi:hypothetical protein